MAGPRGIGADVLRLLREGKTYSAICGELGVSKSTVSYYAKKEGRSRKPGKRGKWTWHQIRRAYSQGASYNDLWKRFGISKRTLWEGEKRGLLVSRPRTPKLSYDEYAAKMAGSQGRQIRYSLKTRILREKLLSYQCAECGIAEWRGNPLQLNLDHINGDPCDHPIGNMRFLCPNCDSQQETFGHKNVIRKKRLAGSFNGKDAAL